MGDPLEKLKRKKNTNTIENKAKILAEIESNKASSVVVQKPKKESSEELKSTNKDTYKRTTIKLSENCIDSISILSTEFGLTKTNLIDLILSEC